jgi:hypothetical protein
MALKLIGVTPETKEKLDKLKTHPSETYESVITRSFYLLELHEDEEWELIGEKNGKPIYRKKYPLIKPEKKVTWRDEE